MTSLLNAECVSIDGRLRPTSLHVGSGQLAAIIGPNGGGKTSLLRAIAGIEPSGGKVRIDGEELWPAAPNRRPYLATFLPASRDLVWPISAADAIALGLPRQDPKRVNELIDLLELEGLGDRPVDRLSTGERARVLLARALAPRPRVLLLDEPLSNLDPYWVLRCVEILHGAVAQGAAALVALHDIDRLSSFDRAILVDGGEVRADVTPREMLCNGELKDAFRIEPTAKGWRVRQAGPRSSR